MRRNKAIMLTVYLMSLALVISMRLIGTEFSIVGIIGCAISSLYLACFGQINIDYFIKMYFRREEKVRNGEKR